MEGTALQFPSVDIAASLNPVLAWAVPILITVGVVGFGIALVFKRNARLGR